MEGDFVLVQFATKKIIVYYIAQVLGNCGVNEYEVKFLRKVSKHTFRFPAVEDKASVERGDMVAKLPPSKSLRDVFSFPYNFHKFDMR